MVQKAEEEAGINEETSDTQALIGNILGNIGMLNTTGFAGMPGAMIAAALGVSASYALPVYLASFAAGAILWWLGKKIAGEKSNVDEAVNEALRKVRLKEATTPPPATPTQKPSGEKLQGGSMGLLIQKFNQLGIENPNLSSVLSRVKSGTKLSPSDNTVLASILTQMLKTSDDKTLMSIFQIFKSIESAK
jgi:hypothetical protein